MSRVLALLVIAISANAQSYTATYDPASLPPTTEGDQAGTNQCGTGEPRPSRPSPEGKMKLNIT
ncbi:hypothetical protein FRC19_000654 [Serendipita sp. 401]|nr:hypothetical protein FRC19_000654 [Serendipita sp. 401]